MEPAIETVFVAIGRIDYDTQEVLGVLPTLEAAEDRCDQTPELSDTDIAFRSYRIEEWAIGGQAPPREWTRGRDGRWQRVSTAEDLARDR